MYELVGSQSLWIDSARRTSTLPCEYEVPLEGDLVRCAEDEVLRLTLSQFSTTVTWGWIAADRNAFHIDGRAIVLTPGNPTLKQLATAITKAYFAAAGAAVDYAVFRCIWEASTNKLLFTSGSGLSLQFPNLDTAEIYGFTGTDYMGTNVQSDRTLMPVRYSSICVHCPNLRPRMAYSGANQTKDGVVQKSTMLAAIPCDAAPFTLLNWRNVDDAFSIVITSRTIGSLRLRFTDFDGNLLSALPDHQLLFRVDTLKADHPTASTLNGMHDTLRTMLLSQALS